MPSLLRELIDYDFKFPAERNAREKELANLSSLSAAQLKELFQGFAQIRLSPELEDFDWAKSPAQFVEQLSAHLWSTHQLDAFRKASNDYADHLRSAVPPDPPPVPRLGITVIGQGVASYDDPLFRKLRAHGAYFSRVKPENGLQCAAGCGCRAGQGASRSLRPLVHRRRRSSRALGRRLPASPTRLSNRSRRIVAQDASRDSNAQAWDPKRCARFWPRCVPPISAWTE